MICAAPHPTDTRESCARPLHNAGLHESDSGLTWSDRPAKELRAGTRLNPDMTIPVYGDGRRSNVRIGRLDKSQRVLQVGGEFGNFTYHAYRNPQGERVPLLTLPASSYDRFDGQWNYLEWIDHKRNACWWASAKTMDEHLVRYSAGIGPRVGVPWSLCTEGQESPKAEQGRLL